MSLTACTGEPAAEPTPTRTASASPTAEPTPTPTTTPEPERPTAMDDPGVDGAVAAATYFLSLYPYVYNTGDLTAWKALSHPECVFCASVSSSVDEMHALGQRQEGTELTLVPRESAEVEAGVWFSVRLDVAQGEWTVVGLQGEPVRSGPAQNYAFTLAVVRDSERWVIRAAEATPSA
ncbi:DUF6318 family protein [Cellulomonas cellasea]|uniref:DUF6318 domain-containing protein n=1 Tax=Cellulomonas cellasea TaxID=43670 RepID=A0A4Y3L181_9CELL|nr:DUF6318 family protein [Cellulomonas cellasea]GEA90112.1 hypothetical protein CCE01nite_40610 [Cellulomonas cellasea]